jgi:3-hydroxyacyl-CoA dehydrogenase
MPLVEIVLHPGREIKYTDQALQFYQAIGKKPIVVKNECPRYVANILQAAICSEAYTLVQRGVVTAQQLGS